MSTEAWPPVSPQRLADSIGELAERIPEPELRAQLHALGVLVASLGGETSGAAEAREPLLARYEAERERDEPAALAILRELARIDRAAVPTVDWSAVSGG